jgi:hypothetical protein
MTDVVGAFLRGEEVQGLGDRASPGEDGSRPTSCVPSLVTRRGRGPGRLADHHNVLGFRNRPNQRPLATRIRILPM